jgi:fatty acid desaturase
MSNRERLKLYSLGGPAAEFAVAAGLTDGDWYRTDVPRSRMKELMRRSDAPAIRDTALWIGIALVAAGAGIALWGTWWAVPCFLVYGVLYGSASDSRWHEAGHGTAFRSRWLDTAVYQIASFCMMRNPASWRWQHTRHHTDTLIVGRDPEIAAMRPARLARILLNLFGLVEAPLALYHMLVNATGRLCRDETLFVPVSEQHKVVRSARIWTLIYLLTIATAIVFHTWLPVVLIGGARFYGTFMQVLYGLTQHAGLGENVIDHRLNTRTVLMNPVNRFLYWNMGYHIEHHMFPMVPYHQLPRLHREIQHDLPVPYPSMWAAYKEIVPAVLRQLKDQTYYIKRELPPGAAPFHGPVDGLLPDRVMG